MQSPLQFPWQLSLPHPARDRHRIQRRLGPQGGLGYRSGRALGTIVRRQESPQASRQKHTSP